LPRDVRLGTDPDAFAAALDDHGIMFARATKEEAADSHRKAAFARETGNYTPRFKEGEILIVTEGQYDYRREGQIIAARRVHKLDPSLAEKFVRTLGTADKLQSIAATLKASDERAQLRRDERKEARLERAGKINDRAAQSGSDPLPGLLNVANRVAGDVFEAAIEPTISAASLLFSFFDPQKTPGQLRKEAIQAEAQREVQADAQIDFSRYTAEQAQEQRNDQQEQAARDRQRENERER
jgi:hypothetical protein